MTTILFDFEGDIEHDWYEVTSGGSGILPDVWFPYGDPAHTVEYGTPNQADPHLEHLVKEGKQSLGWDKVWDTHNGGSGRFLNCAPRDLIHFWMNGRYIYHSGNDNPSATVAPVHMRIGIDPNGSSKPTDATIWSPEQEIAVRGFGGPVEWFMFEISAKALVSIVTLFLYTNPTIAGFRHSGPVWDNGGVEVRPSGNGECWGQPREQYKRIYNVVSSVAEAHKVLDIIATEAETAPGLGDGLQTIGPSSDDAGMGMVEDKTPREWNRPLALHESFRDFYATNYPRARPNLEFRATEPEPEFTLYSQRDERWRDHVYGGGQTLGVAGCLITCVAMLTGDEPPVVARKLADVGALEGAYLSRPELATDAYPDLPYGGTVHWRNVAADLDLLGSWLENGPVVIETEFAPGGAVPPSDQHFVIGLEIDGGDLIIADPWTGEITRLLERYALTGWSLARAVYGARLFGFESGTPPPPLPPSANLLGVHQQKEAAGVPEYYARSSPSVYKTVQNFQWCRAVKEWSPDTITVIRPFPNNITGKDAIEHLVAGIADDLAALYPWIDFVELINEQIPSGNDGAIIEAVDTEIWGMEALKALPGIPEGAVKPLIFNIPPGNPWGPWDVKHGRHDQQPLLVKGIQASFDLFGMACEGYHGYWPSNREAAYLRFAMVNGVRKDVGMYYSFRWEEHDIEYAKHGLAPFYILTEMGPIGTHGPRQDGYIDMMPHDGWKSSDCLGGSRTRLIDELSLWQAECAAWNVTHGNRLLGGTVFTTGGGSKWSSFEWGEAEMRAWSIRLEG